MAEILTSKDLIPAPVQADGLQAGLKEINTDLKEIQNLASTVNNILDKIMTIRNSRMPVQTEKLPLRGSPESINSAKEIQFVEKEKIVVKKINRMALKGFLKNLLEVQADKLPEEVKDTKIRQIIGQNASSFKYNYMGFEFTYENLLDVLTVQLGNTIDQINEEVAQ